MYGQQGRGSWPQAANSWQYATGYYGQHQQPIYNQQQGYAQQNQQQHVFQYQPPPPSRQHQQPLQHDPRQHSRSHTPNPRPHKRVRQDTAPAAARAEPPTAPQHQQLILQPHRTQQNQHQQQKTEFPAAWLQQQLMHHTPPPQQLPQSHLQPQQHLQHEVDGNMRLQRQLHPMEQRSQAETPSSAAMAGSITSSNSVTAPKFPCSNHGNPAAAAWLNGLQQEILGFAQQVVPNSTEQLQRQSRLTAFTSVVQQALPQHASTLQVTLFGSEAAGLALHHSDLDVAITGLFTPDGENGGFDDRTKPVVVRCLRCIDREATYGRGRHLLGGVTSNRLVTKARIPVLKLQLHCGLELDVSMNDDSGLKAARFLTSFQSDYPAIQPLTLLLKSALKQRGLSEVYMGGLGSWSLANMVIAHLMIEDRAGSQADHVGSMLLSFLQRFGVDFHLDRQAVSVKRGGVVAKQLLGPNFTRRQGQLALEDPLTGREVAGGSHRYADVEEVFRKLYERLAGDLANCQQGTTSTSSSRIGDSSSGRHRKFHYSDDDEYDDSDDDDEYGYDAANRSPTYQGRMRRQQQAQAQPQQQSEFQLLEMVLDCKAALDRNAGSAEGATPDGRDSAGGGRWQWSNGAGGRGQAPVVGRKRERW